jgi:hypothetical protein
MFYYHGSIAHIEVGHTVEAMNVYTSQPEVKELEDLLESVRPSDCQFPRIDCVFMAANIEDIENLGANVDYIYSVDLEDGYCECSDLAWYTKASCQLGDGDIDGARESAKKYWSGDGFEDIGSSLMEYRTDECYVIALVG